MIRVVIADDQRLVRSGLRSLVETEDIQVVAEAPNGLDAIEIITALQPDVALMDIRMPVLDGLSATRQLFDRRSSTRVLILTTFDQDEYVFEALQSGASGFLLKDATAEQLIVGIRTVAGGDALLDPTVTRRVVESFARSRQRLSTDKAAYGRLTERELQVLQLIARGLSNSEISRELTVSAATTKTHVSSVLTKLGLRDRVQAVVFAYETGLVQPDWPTPERPRGSA